MLIRDLQYLENVDRAHQVNGSGPFGQFEDEVFTWGSIGGNLGFGSAESDAIGKNSISLSDAKGDAIQGTGSSSSAGAFAWVI